MLEHGGQLRAAAHRYGIPEAGWLDLSTGISPWPWALAELPASTWTRLPEAGDGLEAAACAYYGCSQLLPVPGSQAAIQQLPRLWPRPARVAVLSPCYAEHAHGWRAAGHDVLELDDDAVEPLLDSLDVLVAVNPNNPTGRLLAPQRLLDWHARLAERGGWLLVDEAFMDATPALSLAASSDRPGLIVLRSFGKFFGLAGVRLGFVLAEASLLLKLAERLGPWAVSGPARALGRLCLEESEHHAQQRQRQLQASHRLAQLLTERGLPPRGGSALFQWVASERAERLYDGLARQGVLVRLFREPASLRFGLPADDPAWDRLDQALAALRKDFP
ncbi:threonine-phosphate decarboxylase CobD [Pseudomonas indica]|uniref:threonine-phosphate decarboxylase n=1 Tax=Pseudomonas indica TaxID=137658 RepID=A0A1G9C7R4_9PSED|nr:threonine-phosphate decarboxylase CobD [Pseudomonas indica]SDK47718.1 L-threonine O-3-phosphate decarboxylase [Pseudomonas indica]